MLAKVCSAAVNGIEAYPVEVEVNAGWGETIIVIVGLPDAAVKESRDRVTTALTNSGYKFPMGRTTINLAPADVKKEGPSFDLPIALGMLAASEQIETDQLDNFAIVGELALTGAVRPVKGVLPIAIRARADGKVGVLVPADNAAEAAVVTGLQVIPIQNLREAAGFLEGEIKIAPMKVDITKIFDSASDEEMDFAEVWVAPFFDHLFRFNQGAGDTFNDFMDRLADESGYSELRHVPVAPIGHSAAASWPYYFAAWNPQRTLCALSVSGQWPYFRDARFAPDIWGGRNVDFVPCLESMGEFEAADTWSREGLSERQLHPLMPLSMLANPGQGHFAKFRVIRRGREVGPPRPVDGHRVAPAAELSGDDPKGHRDAIDLGREGFGDDGQLHMFNRVERPFIVRIAAGGDGGVSVA